MLQLEIFLPEKSIHLSTVAPSEPGDVVWQHALSLLIRTYVHLMRSPLNNPVFQQKRDNVKNTYVEMLALNAFAKEKQGGMHFLIIRKRFFFFSKM